MSGGSYNYLSSKDADQLLNDCTMDEMLGCMADRLKATPNGAAAAQATMAIHEAVLAFREEFARKEAALQQLVSQVDKVWRAVELTDSNDSGEKSVVAALESYNSAYPVTAAANKGRRLRLKAGAREDFPHYFADATALIPTGVELGNGQIEVLALGHLIDSSSGLKHDGAISEHRGNQILVCHESLLCDE